MTNASETLETGKESPLLFGWPRFSWEWSVANDYFLIFTVLCSFQVCTRWMKKVHVKGEMCREVGFADKLCCFVSATTWSTVSSPRTLEDPAREVLGVRGQGGWSTRRQKRLCTQSVPGDQGQSPVLLFTCHI